MRLFGSTGEVPGSYGLHAPGEERVDSRAHVAAVNTRYFLSIKYLQDYLDEFALRGSQRSERAAMVGCVLAGCWSV